MTLDGLLGYLRSRVLSSADEPGPGAAAETPKFAGPHHCVERPQGGLSSFGAVLSMVLILLSLAVFAGVIAMMNRLP